MSKGLGKVQTTILSILENEYDGRIGYWVSVYTIQELTGFSQPSISRALKSLEKLDLIEVSTFKSESIDYNGYMRPSRFKQYLLKTNKDKQEQHEKDIGE